MKNVKKMKCELLQARRRNRYLLAEVVKLRSKLGRPRKYSRDDVAVVRELHEAGVSIRAIALDLNMSTRTVQNLLKK